MESHKLSVDGEEEILSIVVEAVVVSLSGIEKRLVSHNFHELAKQFCPWPMPAVVFERNDEL
jgi:hypothetical protein